MFAKVKVTRRNKIVREKRAPVVANLDWCPVQRDWGTGGVTRINNKLYDNTIRNETPTSILFSCR